MNNAAMNIGMHLSFQTSVFLIFFFSSSSDKYSGVEMLGHVVVLLFIFGSVSILFSIVTAF